MSVLSPYALALGLRVEPDGVLAMPFGPGVLGRPGFVHGGAIAGLLEVAALAALRDALGTDQAVAVRPATITIDYMRGGRDRDTNAAGRVVRLGSRVANVVADAWQGARDAPIASARFTFLLDRAADGISGRS